MEFGELIQLSADERKAVGYGSDEAEQAWPASESSVHELEVLILDRILDKQSVLDMMRERSALHHSSQDAFRLRNHIATLCNAHDQLIAYALEQGFDLLPPDQM
ncbi:hypothetical protein BH09PAT4_BH09PAT4_04330 [soil metagenome]